MFLDLVVKHAPFLLYDFYFLNFLLIYLFTSLDRLQLGKPTYFTVMATPGERWRGSNLGGGFGGRGDR